MWNQMCTLHSCAWGQCNCCSCWHAWPQYLDRCYHPDFRGNSSCSPSRQTLLLSDMIGNNAACLESGDIPHISQRSSDHPLHHGPGSDHDALRAKGTSTVSKREKKRAISILHERLRLCGQFGLDQYVQFAVDATSALRNVGCHNQDLAWSFSKEHQIQEKFKSCLVRLLQEDIEAWETWIAQRSSSAAPYPWNVQTLQTFMDNLQTLRLSERRKSRCSEPYNGRPIKELLKKLMRLVKVAEAWFQEQSLAHQVQKTFLHFYVPDSDSTLARSSSDPLPDGEKLRLNSHVLASGRASVLDLASSQETPQTSTRETDLSVSTTPDPAEAPAHEGKQLTCDDLSSQGRIRVSFLRSQDECGSYDFSETAVGASSQSASSSCAIGGLPASAYLTGTTYWDTHGIHSSGLQDTSCKKSNEELSYTWDGHVKASQNEIGQSFPCPTPAMSCSHAVLEHFQAASAYWVRKTFVEPFCDYDEIAGDLFRSKSDPTHNRFQLTSMVTQTV
eukprot:gnl/MRDRNA2_/MRDRNA2_147254_c0_seq1.p1 gnl/MRDRNA2_/MRDRNA2_147254_c0~~gnl/MRDRNA2_/MRDRNA2_147254_c0_seq1.p1  ORF type:complete len:502 (+),score=56.94 gnl/MRDRNA2_/MRDRNA2_147254_c0_seq1:83-1588(+)